MALQWWTCELNKKKLMVLLQDGADIQRLVFAMPYVTAKFAQPTKKSSVVTESSIVEDLRAMKC